MTDEPIGTPGKTSLQRWVPPIAAFFVLGGASGAFFWMSELASSSEKPIIGEIAGVGFAVAAVISTFLLVRNNVSEARLGPIDVEYSPTTVSAGDRLHCVVRFEPRTAGRLAGFNVGLEGYRMERSGGRAHKVTHHRVDRDIQSAEDVEFEAGEVVEVDAEIVMPDLVDGVGTADVLRWDLIVKVDVPLWPDWSRRIEIDMAQ